MGLFITGATGFLGKTTLVKLLKQKDEGLIFILMRGGHKKSALERGEQLLAEISPPDCLADWSKRVVIVEGDLLLPNLGIAQEQRRDLIKKIKQILHIGASTNFADPIELARAYNVEGTRRVLNLAKACSKNGIFERFDYISTAYVAGNSRGIFDENSLDKGQGFSNSYERSKFEAELLLASFRPSFPITVYRPSIIVGHSDHGYTPHFKVLYWPLKLLTKAAVPFCFVNKGTNLDIVPVDYVVKTLVAMIKNPKSKNRTFHLTCGLGKEVSCRRLLEDAFTLGVVPRKKIYPMWIKSLLHHRLIRRFVSPDLIEILDLIEPYNAYFQGIKVRFSNVQTQAFLGIDSPSSPPWDEMAEKLLNFCVKSRWGKRLPQAEHLYYSAL